jgi:thiol:disulfide interchange protein DsbC
MKSSKISYLVAIGLGALAQNSWSHAQPEQDKAAAIRKVLEERFGDLHVVAVRPSAIAGLFEVYSSDSVFYSDASGNYIVNGHLIDTRTRTDLSHQHLDELNAVDFSQLPLEKAIKTVHGKGERRLAVFADPECPYCKKLEGELANIDNVTIYTFLYPLVNIHPAAKVNAHALWCAADRDRAWHEWMLEGKIPASAPACEGDPTDELLALGERLHIASTPTMLFDQGERITGVVGAEQVEQALGAATRGRTVAPSVVGMTDAKNH